MCRHCRHGESIVPRLQLPPGKTLTPTFFLFFSCIRSHNLLVGSRAMGYLETLERRLNDLGAEAHNKERSELLRGWLSQHSLHTARLYRGSVEKFIRFTGRRVEDIDAGDLQAFTADLASRPMSEKTRTR